MFRYSSIYVSNFQEKHEEVEQKPNKYTVKPPRDLRSKFLLMMEQREIAKKEKEMQEEQEKERLRIQVSLTIIL